jgi:glutathione S-transferase
VISIISTIIHRTAAIADKSGAAIAVYLCEVFGWNDMYPAGAGREHVAKRAAINQWLHWHHRNSRDLTVGFFAPLLRPDLKIPPAVAQAQQTTGVAAIKRLEVTVLFVYLLHSYAFVTVICDHNYNICNDVCVCFLSQGHFRTSPFLVGSAATVADVAVFGDVGQMHFLGLLDFSTYPNVMFFLKKIPPC